MHAAVDAAGEIPENPRIRRAEQQIAGLRLRPSALDVFEDPDDLGAGEVGRQRKADLLLEPLDATVGGEPVDDRLRAGVLPDDGVVDGLTGVLVQDDRSLTLVGDPDGRNVVAGQVGLGQCLPDDLANVVPDLLRVVFDPAGLREDLLMFKLAGRDDRPGLVEDDGPTACRALIDRDDVIAHR